MNIQTLHEEVLVIYYKHADDAKIGDYVLH
jgi:hypothetical protein